MSDTEVNSFRELTDQTYNLTKLSEEVSRLLHLHIPEKPGDSDPISRKTKTPLPGTAFLLHKSGKRLVQKACWAFYRKQKNGSAALMHCCK